MKELLRKKYLKKRENLSKIYIKEKSKLIWENLFKLKEYNQCEKIFVFLTMGKEIDTYYFIDKLFKDNKIVCVPIIISKNDMVFEQIKDLYNLQKNKFGILEPNLKNTVKCDEKTMVIVPSLVYSKDRYRIGYGGGYYDKFLNENNPMISVGVCFEEFIINKIEIEKWDKKVDIVITENGYIKN